MPIEPAESGDLIISSPPLVETIQDQSGVQVHASDGRSVELVVDGARLATAQGNISVEADDLRLQAGASLKAVTDALDVSAATTELDSTALRIQADAADLEAGMLNAR